jgi:hypothetical protein
LQTVLKFFFFYNKLVFNNNSRHQGGTVQTKEVENNVQSITTNDSINHKEGKRFCFIYIKI